MARPQKNNLDYFPHDNGMRNDRKIKALRAKFGLTGYAVFNMILEILCESELLVINWNETEAELISGDLNIDSGELTQIMEYLFHIKLIQKANGCIFCKQLDERSKTVFDKRTHDLDSLRVDNGINVTKNHITDTESTQSKVKKSKVKKSIVIPPKIEWVTEYCKERNNNVDSNRFVNHYESKGWMIGKNKMKDWQAAVRTWEKNESDNYSSPKYKKLKDL